MKYIVRVLILLAAFFFGVAANGQSIQQAKFTAGDLWALCQSSDAAVQHGAYKNGFKKTDKLGAEELFRAGQCYGYIRGWMEARDRTQAFVNGKLYVINVLDSKLNDVYLALDKYLREKPLEKGKLADSILFTVFMDNGLIRPEPLDTKPNIQGTVN